MNYFDFDQPSFFDGENFVYWKTRIKHFMQSIDIDLRDIVINELNLKAKQHQTDFDKRCFYLNIKAMQIL